MNGRWVWSTRPDHYRDASGDEHPHLDPTAPEVPEPWCCSSRVRAGDLGVVYRSRERRDLSHLVVVRSDAERAPEPDGGWTCRVRVLARFREPLELLELRADPVLSRWPALRASFVQRCFPVPEPVWQRLLVVGPPELRQLGGRHEAP